MLSTRTLKLSSLAIIALLGLAVNVAWGLGFQLSETKEQLGLKYEVSAVTHESGRVTITLTIVDQGKLKPLDSVSLYIPSNDKSGYSDLSVALATEDVDGKLLASAHLSRELAERAEIHLQTHSPLNGSDKRSDRTWYYHSILVNNYIKATVK